MRSRIRTIKPEAASDEELWDLGVETGLPIFQAFVMLWCQADREGRFEWRPRALKVACLPFWEGDFSRVLDALVTRGFVVRYAAQGREFGLVRSFTKHQQINGKEPASTLPPPPTLPNDYTDVTRDSRVEDASQSCAPHVEDVPIPSDPFPSLPIPSVPGGAGGRPSIAVLAKAYTSDPTATQLRHGDPHRWPELETLWASFETTWGRSDRPESSRDPRVSLALERFAEGRSVEELTEAIRNSRNYRPIAENRSYQRLKTILRDAEQVDMLRAMNRPDVAKVQGGPRQPDNPALDFRASIRRGAE